MVRDNKLALYNLLGVTNDNIRIKKKKNFGNITWL